MGGLFDEVIVMKKFLLAIIFLMSFSSASCSAEKNIDPSAAKDLSVSVEKFCWKYFALRETDKNFFYSPYGIHAVLSILANGASGETRKDILDVLEVASVETLNAGHKNFSALIKKNYPGENFLAEGNLLCVDKNYGGNLDENFKRVVSGDYKSEVRTADFSGNAAGERQKIRRWVADKTKNFITNYNSLASASTSIDILNVISFQGKWKIPFTPSQTLRKEFTNSDGSKGTAAMMSNVFKETIKYRADEKFKAIELPYSGGAVMDLILPADDDALNVCELWNAQTIEYRADFLNGLKNSYPFDGEVVVRILNIGFSHENLSYQDFQKMGLQRLFTDDAKFFNIIKGTSLKLSNATQFCKVDINEQGTKAAAVTEVTMVETTATPNPRPPKKVYFVANRPYILVIRDVESNMTLFAGAINNI